MRIVLPKPLLRIGAAIKSDNLTHFLRRRPFGINANNVKRLSFRDFKSRKSEDASINAKTRQDDHLDAGFSALTSSNVKIQARYFIPGIFVKNLSRPFKKGKNFGK